MAAHTRFAVVRRILATGMVPVVPLSDRDAALGVARACYAGGARVLEFTNRGDGALGVFTEVLEACRDELPDVAVGIGSVSDAATAGWCLNLGADFVVGPTFDAETARICHGRKVAYVPGCGTVTEIAEAESVGCELIKIFPGDALGGPGFVKAVRGPRPWTWLMPTGGVDATEASLAAWFDAGVVAVGIGSKLASADEIARGDWDAVTQRVAGAREHINAHSIWQQEAL